MLYFQIILSIKTLYNKFWTVIFLRAQVWSPAFWKKKEEWYLHYTTLQAATCFSLSYVIVKTQV